MSRFHMLLLATCLVMMTVGCRNRCNNQCGGGLFAGGPATIAPPPTYSLNIPSVARNQPYYAPGVGNTANNGTLSTYGRAPTPATRQAQQTQQGWKGAGTDLSNTNQNPNTGNGQSQNPNGQSVLAPTTFVETNPQQNNTIANPNISSVANRTASLAPIPGTGQSFTDSQNYQTTSVDERTDSTRLAVTDASQVRAPARNYPAGFVGQPVANGYNNQVPQTFVNQNGIYPQQVQPTGYVGNPLVAAAPIAGYQGQPFTIAPGYPPQFQQYPTSSPPTVLAQSTATTNPGSSTQLGWRDRDLTTGRY